MMYYILFIVGYLFISLVVYFVCFWFSKKPLDTLDMFASFAFLFPLLPIFLIGETVIVFALLVSYKLDLYKKKMLAYKNRIK